MKKYFKIITFFLVITLISCNDDDNQFDVILNNENLTELTGTISLEDTNFGTGTANPDDDNFTVPVNYTVDLPQTFNQDARVTITGIRIENADESLSTIVIPAGETSGSGVLNIITTNLGFLGTNYKVKIKGVALFSEDPDVIIEDNFILTSNEVEINVGGSSVIRFGWDDTSDLDIILLNSDGDQITDAQTGANPEIFSMGNTLPDGDYTLRVIYFAVDDSDLNYTFDITNTNGNQIVEGSLSGYVVNDVVDVFNINKTGTIITVTEL